MKTCSISGSSSRHNIAAADRTIESIEEKCRMLADYPEIGPARPEIGPEVRAVAVGSYLVLYKLWKARVDIVRVVHGARRLENLLL